MARQIVTIPDGEFCCDNHNLGCMYEHHESGFHRCRLFNQPIELKEFTVNGERQRGYSKCKACRDTKIQDTGNGIKPDVAPKRLFVGEELKSLLQRCLCGHYPGKITVEMNIEDSEYKGYIACACGRSYQVTDKTCNIETCRDKAIEEWNRSIKAIKEYFDERDKQKASTSGSN